MLEQTTIIEALKHDLMERYGGIRFEKNYQSDFILDVFFSKKMTGFSFFKHAFLLSINGDKLVVKPGTLLSAHLGHDITLELADPHSIDRLIELLEECQKH